MSNDSRIHTKMTQNGMTLRIHNWTRCFDTVFFFVHQLNRIYPTESGMRNLLKCFNFAFAFAVHWHLHFHWKFNWFDDIEWITFHRQRINAAALMNSYSNVENHLTVRQLQNKWQTTQKKRRKKYELVIDGINILTFTYALWVIFTMSNFDAWRDEADI